MLFIHERKGFPLITISSNLRFDTSSNVQVALSALCSVDYKNGNFDDLRGSLANVPFNLAASVDIDEYWVNWKDLFLSAVKDHIPIKTVRDNNSPPWIDTEVRRPDPEKIRRVKAIPRKNKTPERKQKRRTLSQQTKLLIRAKHRQYLTKIESSFKDNPKLFWSYHKAFLGNRSGVKAIIPYKGETAEKTSRQSRAFEQVFFQCLSACLRCKLCKLRISLQQLSDIEVSFERIIFLDKLFSCLLFKVL